MELFDIETYCVLLLVLMEFWDSFDIYCFTKYWGWGCNCCAFYLIRKDEI